MKKKDYYRLVFFYLSIFLVMIGVIQLLPLIVLPFYPEDISYAYCFLIPGIAAIGLGGLQRYILKDTKIVKLEKHYDSLLLVMIWLIAITVSCFPWMLKGDYNFTQAAFEMTSGYSTVFPLSMSITHRRSF